MIDFSIDALFEPALDRAPDRPSHPARAGLRRGKVKTLRPLRPNVGIAAVYERRLLALIEQCVGS